MTGAGALAYGRAVLAAIDIVRAQRRHQIFERGHGFGVHQITGKGRDFGSIHTIQPARNGGKGLIPAHRGQLTIFAHIGFVQPLPGQPVIGKAALVGQPFLIHIVIVTGQDTHNAGAARIDADVGPEGIHHIDAFGLAQFP